MTDYTASVLRRIVFPLVCLILIVIFLIAPPCGAALIGSGSAQFTANGLQTHQPLGAGPLAWGRATDSTSLVGLGGTSVSAAFDITVTPPTSPPFPPPVTMTYYIFA